MNINESMYSCCGMKDNTPEDNPMDFLNSGGGKLSQEEISYLLAKIIKNNNNKAPNLKKANKA